MGGAARARNEAVQAFRLIDALVFPEAGYNIDPRDLRRRRIFLYHSRELLEDVQRTDGEWPFRLGRIVEEPLDIVVEFTYRVPEPERQDEPFVHPAAADLPMLAARARRPTPPRGVPAKLAITIMLFILFAIIHCHMRHGGDDSASDEGASTTTSMKRPAM